MLDLIACGELLIDFVSTVSGVSLIEAPTFKKAPGGAPANVAVGIARLGLSSGFVGMVGQDDFGDFLIQTLQYQSVDTSGLKQTTKARTALAFVSLKEDGERDFMFYRNPSADMFFAASDLDPSYLQNTKIFHYGSISLGAQASRDATLQAVEIARRQGAFISYDPNLRLNLWPSEEEARAGMQLGWSRADLIKVSEEELHFLSGQEDLERGAHHLWHERLKLLVVTQGAAGCTYFTPEGRGSIPGIPVKAIDATGAGDAFVAGLLFKLTPMLHQNWPQEFLEEALRFACATGALATTKNGAIPALPSLQEVEALLAHRK